MEKKFTVVSSILCTRTGPGALRPNAAEYLVCHGQRVYNKRVWHIYSVAKKFCIFLEIFFSFLKSTLESNVVRLPLHYTTSVVVTRVDKYFLTFYFIKTNNAKAPEFVSKMKISLVLYFIFIWIIFVLSHPNAEYD